MRPSISNRIQWLVASVTAFSLSVVVLVLVVSHESIERTMLDTDMSQIREALLHVAGTHREMQWNAPGMWAWFKPVPGASDTSAPDIFKGLPVPFSGEVAFDGRTFLVANSAVEGGEFYIARDITLFEDRLTTIERVIGLTSTLVLLIAFMAARWGGRRLVAPIRELSSRILHTQPGKRMARIPADYRDAELNSIAETFNDFLLELEAYMRRERTLLGMASHELRTPIAVVIGALDIVDDRGDLSAMDAATLARARLAAQEMAKNLDIILKLGRRGFSSEEIDEIRLKDLINEVAIDILHSQGSTERIAVEAHADTVIRADRTLVKILIRNLLQNSLRHTTGAVHVTVQQWGLTLTDVGPDLDDDRMALLHGAGESGAWERTHEDGLGLVVVSIIRDKLGWRIDVTRDVKQKTMHINVCSTLVSPSHGGSQAEPGHE